MVSGEVALTITDTEHGAAASTEVTSDACRRILVTSLLIVCLATFRQEFRDRKVKHGGPKAASGDQVPPSLGHRSRMAAQSVGIVN